MGQNGKFTTESRPQISDSRQQSQWPTNLKRADRKTDQRN